MGISSEMHFIPGNSDAARLVFEITAFTYVCSFVENT